ncbi:TPA: hypothetical protein ACOFD8_000216 [Stenotrophomonas maltophilia]|nr:hypothetical protein [Stenotrophomonas maltophilia]
MTFELFLILAGSALIISANIARIHQRHSDKQYSEHREDFIQDAQVFAARAKQIIGKH